MNKKAVSVALGLAVLFTGKAGEVNTSAEGMNAIIGDCGYEKYSIGESGAAGYCYVKPGVYTVEFADYGIEPAMPVISSPRTSVLMVSNDTQKSTDENTSADPVVVVVVAENVPADKPAETTERQHCNNGEGNGSEGCSPSENGNNDENNTRPNEDHGNNGHGNNP